MIRRATALDALQIASLDDTVFEDSLGLSFIENDLKTNPMAIYYVSLEQGKIIGYIGTWVSDNTTILNFCVDEKYRKMGIGTELFDEAMKTAIGIVSLEVRKSNQNAITFYEHKGFQGVAIRKNYYSNGEDAILMIRK